MQIRNISLSSTSHSRRNISFMWKKFEMYSIKKIVLVRKGRAFYATLYQEVFFCNPGGGSLRNLKTYYIHLYYHKWEFGSTWLTLGYNLSKTWPTTISDDALVFVMIFSLRLIIYFIRCQFRWIIIGYILKFLKSKNGPVLQFLVCSTHIFIWHKYW